MILKKMVFLTKMDGYQKLCDTKQNVTAMGVILKGVYCSSKHSISLTCMD
jgi:hypothetical protein